MPCVALDIVLIALIVRAMDAPMGATFTETDRMESNKKVTVTTVTFLVMWAWGSQMA